MGKKKKKGEEKCTCSVQVRHKDFLTWLKGGIAREGDKAIEAGKGDDRSEGAEGGEDVCV